MAVETIVGVHAVRSVLAHAPTRMLELWLADTRGADAEALERSALAAGISVRRVPRRTIERHSGGERHQGVLARCRPARRSQVSLESLIEAHGNALLLVAVDGVEDPQNLGAIVRTAACFGAHGVIRGRSRGAPLGAGALRSSAGGDAIVPVVEVPNLARALDALADAGVTVIGAAGEGVPLASLALAPPLALVLGGEHDGLRHLTREKCTALARIPMPGLDRAATPLDSLNVSVAAGVLLHEVVRRVAD